MKLERAYEILASNLADPGESITPFQIALGTVLLDQRIKVDQAVKMANAALSGMAVSLVNPDAGRSIVGQALAVACDCPNCKPLATAVKQ